METRTIADTDLGSVAGNTDASALPLVSIGLPTFNGAATLPTALKSIEEQNYPNLELIISDNCSSDETFSLSEDFCRRIPWAKAYRQATNIGAAANFEFVRAQARGRYFMWIGDDDEISANYVAVCLEEHVRDSRHSLVAGKAIYPDNPQELLLGVEINLRHPDAARRVNHFFQRVRDNGTFYGVMVRDIIDQVTPLREAPGDDWRVVASLAALGYIKTTSEAWIVRGVGSSRAFRPNPTDNPLRVLVAGPHSRIAAKIFMDIAWRLDPFRQLPLPRRVGLAARCGFEIVRRFVVPTSVAVAAGKVGSSSTPHYILIRWVVRQLRRVPGRLPRRVRSR